MNKVFSLNEQIIANAAATIGVSAVIIRNGRELVSDDEKIWVYDSGVTYWIDKKDLYEPPFPVKPTKR